jgi:hypothetical protein
MAPELTVFAGPTLGAAAIREVLGERVRVLPPVAQGDVFRAAQARPRVIAIVDGYFDRVPSVWHKEILWAMAQGIHVFGAASMGALRAAELADYGMVGVGRVFQMYRDGQLEDDDEVAVAHASAERGFAAASEALVNVRATLEAARAGAIIDASAEQALLQAARQLYYPERHYRAVMANAARAGVDAANLQRLETWLPGRRVDQKREDALELLAELARFLAAAPPPKQVAYRFEHTDAWENARQHFLASEGYDRPSTEQAVMDELKLSGKLPATLALALLRFLALQEGRRLGRIMDGPAIDAAAESFRRERGLLSADDFAAWIREQRLEDDSELTSFMKEQATVQWIEAVFAADAAGVVTNALRASGEYGDLVDRAAKKQAALAAAGLTDPEVADTGLDAHSLWCWFLGRSAIEPADLDREIRARGFETKEEMLKAVVRERLARDLI